MEHGGKLGLTPRSMSMPGDGSPSPTVGDMDPLMQRQGLPNSTDVEKMEDPFDETTSPTGDKRANNKAPAADKKEGEAIPLVPVVGGD